LTSEVLTSSIEESNSLCEVHTQGIVVVECLGRGGLPYMGYMGIFCCEGYGFQAVYSRIGYINQSVWV